MLEFANWIAVIGTLIALITLIHSVKTNNKKLDAQAYIAYTAKYDSLIGEMPGNYWEKRSGKNFVFSNPEEKYHLSKKLHSYFQLCCQQFYLRKNNLISQDIREMWEEEIVYNLKLNSLMQHWEKHEAKYFGIYEEFSDYVKKIHDGQEPDPKEWASRRFPIPLGHYLLVLRAEIKKRSWTKYHKPHKPKS